MAKRAKAKRAKAPAVLHSPKCKCGWWAEAYEVPEANVVPEGVICPACGALLGDPDAEAEAMLRKF